MKRKQLAAIALSAILSFSACIPAAGAGVYAAENDANPDYVAEETTGVGASDAFAEAAGQAGVPAQDKAEEALDDLPVNTAEQTGESAQDSAEEAFDPLSGEVPAGTDTYGEADAEEPAADAETASGNEIISDSEAVSGEEAADAGPADSGAAGQEEVSADEGTAAQEDISADEGTAAQEEVSADEGTAAQEEISADEGTAAQEEASADEGTAAQEEVSADEGAAAQDLAPDALEAVAEEDGSQEGVGEKAAGGVVEASEENFANAAELAVGDVVDVNITGDEPAFFRFTTSESGRYAIYSVSSGCDPAMLLYNAGYNIITSCDDEINGANFRFSGNLEAETTYYIQAFCHSDQAVFQLHLEKTQFYARAVDDTTEFYLEKGESQTLQISAGAAEGEEITYHWYRSDGSELSSDVSDPAFCKVENVQSYTRIFCVVSDQSGNEETIWFSLHVNGVISAWPAGEAPDVKTRLISAKRGSTENLLVDVSTDVGDYTIVWYDEDDQVIQDDNNPCYTLCDIQQDRRIRCHVADTNDPDNCADVYFQISSYVEFYVYPEDADKYTPETNIDITEKDSVTLHTMVETNGSTEGITYKWEIQKCGEEEWTEITGIQGDTCEVSMPQKATYRCTVTDADGNSGIATFRLYLEIDYGVYIYGYDENGAEVYSKCTYDADHMGGAVELRTRVETGVTDRLSYQWYKDTGHGEEIIDGAVNSSFTVDNPVNGTRYICVADAGYGDHTCAFTYAFRHYNDLNVYTNKVGYIHSEYLEANKADSFTLSPYVTAENTKGLTYEWQMCHNEDENYIATGDTSSTLTVNSPAHGDVYKCIVTDAYGNTDEVRYYFRVNTHLRVYAAEDALKRDLFYIDITGKDSLTLNAVAEADEGTALTYQWRIRDESGEWYTIDGMSGECIGGGTTSLQLDTLTGDKDYYCSFQDNYDHQADLIFRLVSRTPTWSIYPRGASSGEDTAAIRAGYGSLTELFVVTEGSPNNLFYYTWKNANGRILASASDQSYFAVKGPKTFSKYSCTVTDYYGREATVWFELYNGSHPGTPSEAEMAAAQVLKVGETATAQKEAGSDGACFVFTPEEDGHYILYSSRDDTQDCDPCGKLFSRDGSVFTSITSDNDSKGNRDFVIYSDLTAGKSYYLRAQDFNGGAFSYPVHVERADFYAYRQTVETRFIYAGERGKFRVRAWSTTGLFYKWYEGDADGTEDSFAEVSGVTGPEYFPVIKKDCSFMCRVSDEAGHSKDIVFYIKSGIDQSPDESYFADAQEICSGDSRKITLTEENISEMFEYTAEKKGMHHFYVNPGNDEFYGTIELYKKEYQDNGGYYSYTYQTGGDSIEYEMKAGDTVYLKVFDTQYRTGSCTLYAEFMRLQAEAVTDTEVNVDRGQEVSFGVRSESAGYSVCYQWYRETAWNSEEYTPIEGESADSYTLTARKNLHYKCIVTDYIGQSVTIVFAVYVSDKPEDQDFEGAAAIKAGDIVQVDLDPDNYAEFFEFVPEKTCAYTVSMICDENDTAAAPVVDLYDNNHNKFTVDTNSEDQSKYICSFPGEEGETYYIRARSEDANSAGSYTLSMTECTDLCAYGTNTSRTITPGEETSLDVKAWSSSSLHYQWFYNTEDAYYQEEDPSEIQGASGASYTPASPLSGCYICKVWDDDGNSKNLVFTLKVENSLTFDDSDSEISCQLGKTAFLKALVSAVDTEGLQYRWQEYDDAGQSWIDIEGAADSSFTTSEIEEKTVFRVIITDRFNNVINGDFTVFVDNNFSAAYVRHEDDACETIVDGVLTVTFDADKTPDSVLEVAVEGTDTDNVTYKWGCKSGDQSTVTIEETSARCIPQYDGYYFCKATDKFGNERVVTFRVIIENDLHFTRTKGTTLEVLRGQTATLRVDAAALDPKSIRYRWYKDDKNTTFLGETGENYYEVTPESDEEKYFCCLADTYRHYNDSRQVHFTVRRVTAFDLSKAEITISAGSLIYDGKAKTPAVTVKYDGKTLAKNTDYKASYKNNTNAGTNTAQVTITGIGNYKASVVKKFSIAKAAQKFTVSAVKTPVGKTVKVSVTGAKGTKTFKSANSTIAAVNSKTGVVTGKKVGTVKITVTSAATSNYKAASKTVTATVLPAATTKITAENLATGIKVTWNKVTGANGYILYRNNAKIATLSGNAKVTYTDSKANTNGTKYTYKVVAKASTGTSTLSKSLATYRLARPAVSSLTNSAAGKMTVKWAKNAKATGYQIQYTTDSKFKSGVKTIKITKAATVSTVIAKLTKTKTYHVRMRTYKTVGSTSYYSTWSASKKLKITK